MASRTQLLILSLGRRFSQQVKESVLAVQDYVVLTARGLAALVTPPRYQRELITQMDSIGVGGVSKIYGETDLGGFTAVGKIVVVAGGR